MASDPISAGRRNDRSATNGGRVDEARFVEQERQFREILKFCPAAVLIVDEDGRLLFHNARLRELLGYEKSELELIDTRKFWLDLEHRSRIIDALRQRGGQLRNEQVVWKTKNGGLVHLLLSYVQVAYAGGNVGFAGGRRVFWVYGITALIEREAQIVQQERQLRETVEYCPAGLLVVDEDGRLLFHNRRLGQLLGYDEQELKLVDTRKFWHDIEHRARIIDHLRERGGQLISEEVVWKTKEGQLIHLLLSYVQVAYQGGHVGFSGAKRLAWVYDITPMREAEQARVLSERRLAAAIENISEGFSL